MWSATIPDISGCLRALFVGQLLSLFLLKVRPQEQHGRQEESPSRSTGWGAA